MYDRVLVSFLLTVLQAQNYEIARLSRSLPSHISTRKEDAEIIIGVRVLIIQIAFWFTLDFEIRKV